MYGAPAGGKIGQAREARACVLAAFGLLFSVSGCGSDSSDSVEETRALSPADAGAQRTDAGAQRKRPRLKITSPEDGVSVAGTVALLLDVTLPDEFEGLWLKLDDEDAVRVEPNQAIALNTFNWENGSHDVALTLRATDGTEWSDEIELDFDNSDLHLVRYATSELAYGPGAEVALELWYSESELDIEADFSSLDPDFDPDDVTVEALEDGAYVLRYPLASDLVARRGKHSILLRATNDAGYTAINSIEVTYYDRPVQPIEVAGATFIDLPPRFEVAGDASGDLQVTTHSDTWIAGDTVQVSAEWEDIWPSATRLAIWIEGYHGFFAIDLAADSDDALDEVDDGPAEAAGDEAARTLLPTKRLAASTPLPGNTGIVDIAAMLRPAATLQADVFNVQIALLDQLNRQLAATSTPGTPALVGSGRIQVSLKWSGPADLDLILVDPEGNQIDFAAPHVGSGFLDLDANALCELSPITAENVFFDFGEEPHGRYQMRANLFDTCGEDEVAWEMTIKTCHGTETKTGTFNTIDVDQSGVGQLIHEADISCEHLVRGWVTYDKGAGTFDQPLTTGVGRGLPLEVRRVSDDTKFPVDATTNPDGTYFISFDNPNEDDYYVLVAAAYQHPTHSNLHGEVTPTNNGPRYTFRSTVDVSGEDRNVILPIHIPTDRNAGAFNIADKMRAATDWIVSNVPDGFARSKIPQLNARWTRNQGTATHYDSSTNPDHILLAGVASDTNEWDDAVIFHEIMHHVLAKSFPFPAQVHSSAPVPQSVALGEGLATALALDAHQLPLYFDRTQTGTGFDDMENAWSIFLTSDPTGIPGVSAPLETIPIPDPVNRPGCEFMYFTQFTSHHCLRLGAATMSAIMSENTVAVVVWDLLDSMTEPHDQLTVRTEVFDAIFNFFPTPGRIAADRRGVPGSTDLVDLLDPVRTRAGSSDSSFDHELECITEFADYPYDFPGATDTPACPR